MTLVVVTTPSGVAGVVVVAVKVPLAVHFTRRSATRTPRVHMACVLPRPKSRAYPEIDQPMIFAEFLAAGRRDSGAAGRSRKAEWPTLCCRTAMAELTDDVHWRKGLPVKADRTFRSPIRFVAKSWSAGIDVAASSVERATLDPPGPSIFDNRGRGRRRRFFSPSAQPYRRHWHLGWRQRVLQAKRRREGRDGVHGCYDAFYSCVGQRETCLRSLWLMEPACIELDAQTAPGDLCHALRGHARGSAKDFRRLGAASFIQAEREPARRCHRSFIVRTAARAGGKKKASANAPKRPSGFSAAAPASGKRF
jgi:hypothetical protein